jgi:hypothetical protein
MCRGYGCDQTIRRFSYFQRGVGSVRIECKGSELPSEIQRIEDGGGNEPCGSRGVSSMQHAQRAKDGSIA